MQGNLGFQNSVVFPLSKVLTASYASNVACEGSITSKFLNISLAFAFM
jgi:hypothetical protein